MANQYVNKVVYGNETIVDMTDASIRGAADASKIANGETAYGADGSKVTGTNTYDADTKDATLNAAEALTGKTFYKNGAKLTGTMPNNGGVTGTISTKAGEYSVPQGYHDGSGKVSIAAAEQAKLIAGNIKSGITVLGVTGTYTGEAIVAQPVNITPYTTAQTILPPTGADYISQANVAAIAYTETDNAAGGKTVTIGTVAPAA